MIGPDVVVKAAEVGKSPHSDLQFFHSRTQKVPKKIPVPKIHDVFCYIRLRFARCRRHHPPARSLAPKPHNTATL
jgi:hypothetical protein